MKFVAQKTDLADALQKAHSVVASKSTLSILANVLIETAEDAVVFTTTNLQVGIRCQAPANVLEAGASTVPARTLFGIVRELPPAEVAIEVDQENVASVSCGTSFFKILGISKDEFPRVADFDGEPLFSVPQLVLKKMLHRTSFAVSREDPRHFLTGMHFSIQRGRLSIVGTDGRRLSKISNDINVAEDYTASLIVPIKAIEELEKMLGVEGDVLVSVSGNQAGFRVGTDLLASLLIDAKFPDYEGVIPKHPPAKAVLAREEFAAVVRQAALLTSEQSSSVKLQFEKEGVVITASTPELGEARVGMPIKYEGEPMAIGFNPICLKEALGCMDEEEITLAMTDSVSPGVITGEGDFLHLLMPMRLPETAT
jgi:DNA polymerase-3 subunit beta